MPFPFLPLLGLGGGMLQSLFGRQRQPDPATVWRQLFQTQMGELNKALAPQLAGLQMTALQQGSALGQNIAGSLGSVGAGSTGAGRVAGALGQTLGPMAQAQAAADFRARLVELASGGASSMLPAQLEHEGQNTGFEDFMNFLATAGSSGLLGQVLGGFKQQKPAAGGGSSIGGIGYRPSFGFNTTGSMLQRRPYGGR